jgi:dinuclear metal center YbgI/SA1388 family protein
MSVTVGQILELLEKIAPVELAEEWDNVGLLVGSRDAKVDCVLCALDLNRSVLEEAIEKGAQMIVTHHPIMFRGRKNVREDDEEGRLICSLIRAGISLAAMHTNFDNVHPGVNDALAEKLGLRNVRPMEHGMCAGCTDAMTLGAFADVVRKCLGGSVRIYGDGEKIISKVAVLGGAGEDYVPQAIVSGVDVFVTGEMGYHKGLDAVSEGLCVLEAGHAETENPAISMLAGGLQKAADGVQCNVRIYVSESKLFR